MQKRGFTPTVVDNAIKTGEVSPNKELGRLNHYDRANNISVITENDKVITVKYGPFKEAK